MPAFQTMGYMVNRYFHPDNIREFPKRTFASGELIDVFQQMGIIQNDAQASFIRGIPMAIRETLRAVLNSALNREPQMPVTFAWMPGYDYEVTVSESPHTKDSIGGITIFLRTRYPGDPHPLSGQSAS